MGQTPVRADVATRGKGNNHQRVNPALENFDGTWRRFHRQIWLIFTALDRLASNLLIGGVVFVDRCLDDVDLKRGSSGGA